jgi:excisionase family DNA binding protein
MFSSPGRLLTTAEVAALPRVNCSAVSRWTTAGKLTATRTLGGHRRYPQTRSAPTSPPPLNPSRRTPASISYPAPASVSRSPG